MSELKAEDETEALIETMELIVKKLADTHWLVLVLHVLDPHDEIFSKHYRYVPPPRNNAIAALPLISNDDAFFDGLPQLPASR